MTNISNELDIRYMHHQMRMANIRARNKRKATWSVAGGLLLAIIASVMAAR